MEKYCIFCWFWNAVYGQLFPQIVLYNLLICVDLLWKILRFVSIMVALRVLHGTLQWADRSLLRSEEETSTVASFIYIIYNIV